MVLQAHLQQVVSVGETLHLRRQEARQLRLVGRGTKCHRAERGHFDKEQGPLSGKLSRCKLKNAVVVKSRYLLDWFLGQTNWLELQRSACCAVGQGHQAKSCGRAAIGLHEGWLGSERGQLHAVLSLLTIGNHLSHLRLLVLQRSRSDLVARGLSNEILRHCRSSTTFSRPETRGHYVLVIRYGRKHIWKLC